MEENISGRGGLMRALVVNGAGDFSIEEKTLPIIEKPSDVLIKVKAVGICGSDIKIIQGKNTAATYPRIIGHEVCGEIVGLGSNANGFKLGELVSLEPIHYCGECYACRRGRGNVCRELTIHGINIDGGFCEYMVADYDKLHKIPEGVNHIQGVMVEPYSLGREAAKRARVQKDDVVAILGAGPIGLMLIDTLSSMGVETIIASDMLETRLNLAREFGAKYVIDASCEDNKQRLLEITEGEGPNVVFDCTGLPSMFNFALEIASPAGTVVPMAFSAAPVEITTSPIGRKELDIVGSRLAINCFPDVIADFKGRTANLDKLITHTYKLDDYKAAFEMAQSKDPTLGKVVVLMED